MFNPVSFKGQYVKSSAISTINRNETDDYLKVSLVEMSPDCKDDFRAVSSVNYLWGYNQTLAQCICDNMDKNLKNKTTGHFYALTTQSDNFEKMEPDKIIGLAETTDISNDKSYINFFVVDPRNTHDSVDKKYNNIGTVFLNLLIDLFKDKKIGLSSTEEAVGFYEKFGFKQVNGTYFER